MSTACSPTASPNRRKRAFPNEDTKAEVDIGMGGSGEVALSSPTNPSCDESLGAANKKQRVEVTPGDPLTRESLVTIAGNEVMEDQKAFSQGEQPGTIPSALNKPALPAKRKKLTRAEKQAQDEEKAQKVCDLA
jgi:hypothetical protein